MSASLIINHNPSETRVALLEDKQPVEVYIERAAERGVTGNIYRGRVVRVLRGMQAAFVEMGLDRTGFLYVDDAVLPSPPGQDASATPAATSAGSDADQTPRGSLTGGGFRAAPTAEIGAVLQQGEEILVQVEKEPIGQKGARITRQVTIPGRTLVLMPYSHRIGVSHRIESESERERLRGILGRADASYGYIVRTAAEGVEEDQLLAEAGLLAQLWRGVKKKGEATPAPALVFEDLDLVLRATRDLFAGAVERIVVDSAEEERRIAGFVHTFAPDTTARIEFYDEAEPIFERFGIEATIDRALERKVWLKSGGSIIIDQAEALTVVDVNSGKFVGKTNLEDTITKLNLEAVREIACQLRLRNIGGIIIIDFIDMSEAENRDKVLASLADALSHDKVKTTIVRMSEIGLVEMTRKRVRDSLGQALTEPCPYCQAKGFVKSERTAVDDLLREIEKGLRQRPTPRILVNMEAALADYLYAHANRRIADLEERYDTMVVPVAREGYHRERFEIVKSEVETA